MVQKQRYNGCSQTANIASVLLLMVHTQPAVQNNQQQVINSNNSLSNTLHDNPGS
jgi:hypothetical protein